MRQQVLRRAKVERVKRGWTQHEVAARVHTQSQLICSIETGYRRPLPSHRVVRALARLYGVPAESLQQPVE